VFGRGKKGRTPTFKWADKTFKAQSRVWVSDGNVESTLAAPSLPQLRLGVAVISALLGNACSFRPWQNLADLGMVPTSSPDIPWRIPPLRGAIPQ
jgi:hypothetical protein